jgi:hypothetical protein
MMNQKFRVIKPLQSDWLEAKAESFAEAIQQWHYDNVSLFDISIRTVSENGGSEVQSFALFESDTGEQLISRICSMGITRQGGVKRREPKLDILDVAKALDVNVAVLLEATWDNEEQYS